MKKAEIQSQLVLVTEIICSRSSRCALVIREASVHLWVLSSVHTDSL